MITINNMIGGDISVITPPPPPGGAIEVKAALADGTEVPLGLLGEVRGLKDSYYQGEQVELTLVPNNIGLTDRTYSLLSWSNGDTSLTTTVEVSAEDQTITARFDAAPVDATTFKSWQDQTISGTYVQVADIDLSDMEGAWRGVTKFSGSYEGAGHSITGFKHHMREYAGLFNTIEDGVVMNLTVDCEGFDENTESLNPDPGDADSFGGAVLAGKTYVAAGKPVQIINVTTNGTLNGDMDTPTCHNTGGIVARSNSAARTIPAETDIKEYIRLNGLTLKGCVNNADVYDTRGSGLKAGGIIGYGMCDVVLENCVNHGDVITNTLLSVDQNVGIGGIIGNMGAFTNVHSIFVGCTADGQIVCPDGTTGVGELTGYMRNGTFSNSNKVLGAKQALANTGSETGYACLATQGNDGNWTLLDSYVAPTLNTDTVYKYMAGSTNYGLNIAAASGSYIVLDTSFCKPAVTFNGVTALEEPVSGSIIKFVAA